MQIRMSAARRFSAVFVAAATCGAVGLTAVPANAMGAQPQELAMSRLAKPPTKLGSVKNLKAEATKPGASYVVKATWDRLTGANAYEASMIDAAGTVLAKSRVTETTFSAQTKLGAGSVVTRGSPDASRVGLMIWSVRTP